MASFIHYKFLCREGKKFVFRPKEALEFPCNLTPVFLVHSPCHQHSNATMTTYESPHVLLLSVVVVCCCFSFNSCHVRFSLYVLHCFFNWKINHNCRRCNAKQFYKTHKNQPPVCGAKQPADDMQSVSQSLHVFEI